MRPGAGIVLVPAFAGMVVATVLFHELAHFGAAHLVGVPVESAWFDLGTLSAGVTVSAEEGSWQLAVVRYSGGVVAGLIWVMVYMGLNSLKKSSGSRGEDELRWAIGLGVAMMAFWQLGQGFLEANYFDS